MAKQQFHPIYNRIAKIKKEIDTYGGTRRSVNEVLRLINSRCEMYDPSGPYADPVIDLLGYDEYTIQSAAQLAVRNIYDNPLYRNGVLAVTQGGAWVV